MSGKSESNTEDNSNNSAPVIETSSSPEHSVGEDDSCHENPIAQNDFSTSEISIEKVTEPSETPIEPINGEPSENPLDPINSEPSELPLEQSDIGSASIAFQEETDSPETMSVAQFDLSKASPSLVGQVIFERYAINQELGRGNSCVVYSAKNLETNEHVAIKTLLIPEKIANHSFRVAVTKQSRIVNQNIVKSIAYLETVAPGCQPFFVMENLSAMTPLSRFGRISNESDMISVITLTGEALIAAHKMQVVHGKLSPEKILVLKDNDQFHLRLIDFARTDKEDADSHHRDNLYRSPERRRGGAASVESDVFSLGAIAYQVLTGHEPPGPQSYESIRKFAPEIPCSEMLDLVIQEALEPDKNLRIQTAQEFLDGITEWVEAAHKQKEHTFPPNSGNGYKSGSHPRLDIGIIGSTLGDEPPSATPRFEDTGINTPPVPPAQSHPVQNTEASPSPVNAVPQVPAPPQPPTFETGAHLFDIGIIPPSPPKTKDANAKETKPPNLKSNKTVPQKLKATFTRLAAIATDRIPNQTAVDPRNLIGTTLFGTYRVKQLIGESSTTIVYLAEHMFSGSPQRVAIKTVTSNNPAIIEAFSKDARIQSNIQGPDIIETKGYLESSDGMPFLVMEFLDGINLGELLDAVGQLQKEEEFASLLAKILAAVSYAHKIGVVHGNLKPSNIFLLEQNGGFAIKLADFGHYKPIEEAKSTQQADGKQTFEFRYLSPEQLLKGECSDRSDIYAIAQICYKLLAGRLPYSFRTIPEQRNALRGDAPYPRISELLPQLRCGHELSEILDHALERDPDCRCESIEVLGVDIENWLASAKLVPINTEEQTVESSALPLRRKTGTTEILKAQAEDIIALKRKQFDQEQTVLMQFASGMAAGPRKSPTQTGFRIVTLTVGLIFACTVITFYVVTNFQEIKAGFISASAALSRMSKKDDESIVDTKLSQDQITKTGKVTVTTGSKQVGAGDSAVVNAPTGTGESATPAAPPPQHTHHIFKYEDNPNFNKFTVTKTFGKPKRL